MLIEQLRPLVSTLRCLLCINSSVLQYITGQHAFQHVLTKCFPTFNLLALLPCLILASRRHLPSHVLLVTAVTCCTWCTPTLVFLPNRAANSPCVDFHPHFYSSLSITQVIAHHNNHHKSTSVSKLTCSTRRYASPHPRRAWLSGCLLSFFLHFYFFFSFFEAYSTLCCSGRISATTL